MVTIDQSQLAGKKRDRPISSELETLLQNAGQAANIDTIFVYSGGQPGTRGTRTGSTRHDGGRAADLYLVSNGKTLSFTDSNAPSKIRKFITACAAYGANGMGAGVSYMGKSNLHIGFGATPSDNRKIVWGAAGRSANAPQWLRDAAKEGWFSPPDWILQLETGQPEDLPEEEDLFLDGGPERFDSITDIPPRFTEDVIRGAQESQRVWGIPASITLAQWALESGYGASMPAGSNNPFGIKARPGEPSVTSWTSEFQNGRWVRIRDEFRSFPDLEAAFIRHGRLLGTAGAYARARQFLGEPERFADALTGVYATDPNYGSKLKSIMRSNDLYRFDLAAGASGQLAEIHTDEVRIAELQQRLMTLGFDPGGIDGKFGPRTASALSAFQRDRRISETGIFDSQTLVALGAVSEVAFKTDQAATAEDGALLALLRTLTGILEHKDGSTDMSSNSDAQAELIRKLLKQLSEASAKDVGEVGPVNNWLGQFVGRLLNGRKTGLGIVGLLATVLLPGLFPSVFGPLVELFSLAGSAGGAAAEGGNTAAGGTGTVGGQTVLQWFFGLLTTWGIAGKIEKAGARANS